MITKFIFVNFYRLNEYDQNVTTNEDATTAKDNVFFQASLTREISREEKFIHIEKTGKHDNQLTQVGDAVQLKINKVDLLKAHHKTLYYWL